MPKTQKEPKSCHDCGCEAIDNCESEKKHIPFDETLPPCLYCTRNVTERDGNVRADFYDETWTLDSDRSPIIEDPDPTEQKLLRTLHILVNEDPSEQEQKFLKTSHIIVNGGD
jgi:hypothetical protein